MKRIDPHRRRNTPARGLVLACGAFVLLACIGGCNRRADRVVVSGTVRYAGEPLPDGEIRFLPAEGTTGPLTVAEIKDGTYTADSHLGVPVGQHRIEIRRFDWSNHVPGPGSPPPKQLLPGKYNEKSELTLIVNGDQRKQIADFDLLKVK